MHVDKPCDVAAGIQEGQVQEIWIDGASLNNGKEQPSAGFGIYWGPDHKENKGLRLPKDS